MNKHLNLMITKAAPVSLHPDKYINALQNLAVRQNYDVQIHLQLNGIRVEVAVYDEEQEQSHLFVAKGYQDIRGAIESVLMKVYTDDACAPIEIDREARMKLWREMAAASGTKLAKDHLATREEAGNFPVQKIQ